VLSRLGQWSDLLVRLVAYTSLVIYPGLVLCTLYEVLARYVLNRPTIWAFDIVFMLHGALFMLTAAYVLQKSAHVRIDILSTRLPHRVQHAVNLAFYALVFLPAIWIVGAATIRRAYSAFMRGEVELVSAWGPLIWPFFSAVALGFVMLWLQALVEAARHAAGVMGSGPLSRQVIER
jgi:TRAP-type mannitol/chloroaromatic compound transport system permease small subunit